MVVCILSIIFVDDRTIDGSSNRLNMIYRQLKNKKEHTLARIASFEQENASSEYMLMMQVDDVCLSYTEQIQALKASFDECRKDCFPEARPVFMRFFLSDAANQTAGLEKLWIENAGCAVSVVEQPPLDGSKIALWAYLQTSVKVKALPKGLYAVEKGAYIHYWRGSVLNPEMTGSSERQMRELLEEYVSLLEEQSCRLEANAIRTWIFVQNVDVNYAGVVRARNEIFQREGLTPQSHFIASTGIQGRNANPKVLVQWDTYALKGLSKDKIQYLHAPSHLNPTYEYGVSFERGTCVHFPDYRQVFISGTASIDNQGQVLYVGDVRQQTFRMWENVEMLLKEADCDFGDVAQMIVYLRDISDYEVVRRLFAERFPEIPMLMVHAPVCRPAWLIEMECIAFKASSPKH